MTTRAKHKTVESAVLEESFFQRESPLEFAGASIDLAAKSYFVRCPLGCV
jgi:hypothetical protein